MFFEPALFHTVDWSPVSAMSVPEELKIPAQH
jgi:hypothetical protein